MTWPTDKNKIMKYLRKGNIKKVILHSFQALCWYTKFVESIILKNFNVLKLGTAAVESDSLYLTILKWIG